MRFLRYLQPHNPIARQAYYKSKTSDSYNSDLQLYKPNLSYSYAIGLYNSITLKRQTPALQAYYSKTLTLDFYVQKKKKVKIILFTHKKSWNN